MGQSAEWMEIELFEAKALEIAADRPGLTGAWTEFDPQTRFSDD